MKSAFSFPLILVFLVGAQNFALAQSPAPQQSPLAAVPTNIRQLFIDDQAERTVRGVTFKYGHDVHSRDAMRRAEAKSLLAVGELKTAQDFHDAAFIFQHGDQADDFLLAHILAVESIVKGDASSKWIAAATLDRYLQAIGQKQVFGTQYLSKNFLYIVQHKNDPDAMGQPQAQEKGSTQDPYNPTLVPDALRADFCVPTAAAQGINLSDLNAGKPMTNLIPPGCRR